jgi:hypothetical protein
MPAMMVWPLVIDRDAGRVLGGEARQACPHLLLVALGLRLDRVSMTDGEVHLFQHHRMSRVGQRVAGRRVLEAGERQDVAARAP